MKCTAVRCKIWYLYVFSLFKQQHVFILPINYKGCELETFLPVYDIVLYSSFHLKQYADEYEFLVLAPQESNEILQHSELMDTFLVRNYSYIF